MAVPASIAQETFLRHSGTVFQAVIYAYSSDIMLHSFHVLHSLLFTQALVPISVLKAQLGDDSGLEVNLIV